MSATKGKKGGQTKGQPPLNPSSSVWQPAAPSSGANQNATPSPTLGSPSTTVGQKAPSSTLFPTGGLFSGGASSSSPLAKPGSASTAVGSSASPFGIGSAGFHIKPFAAPSLPTSSALTTPASLPYPPLVPDPRLQPVRDVDISGSVVVVRVGEPANKFYVHRGVLQKSSEYVKTIWEAECSKNDSEPVIHFPKESPEAFAVYSKWLYTGGIMAIPAGNTDPSTTDSKDKTEWLNLARAYVLGETLIDIDFKDTVIDAMRAKIRSSTSFIPRIWDAASEMVLIIYHGTHEDSQARRFLVDLYYGHGGAGDMEKRGVFPVDFLYDLAQASLSRRAVPKTPVSAMGGSSFEKCKYHGHGAERACYSDGKR